MKFAYRFITLAVLGLLIHFNSPDAGSVALASGAGVPPTAVITETPRSSGDVAKPPVVIHTQPAPVVAVTPDTSKTVVNTSVPTSQVTSTQTTQAVSNSSNPFADPNFQSATTIPVTFNGITWEITARIIKEDANPFTNNQNAKPKLRITMGTEAGVPGFNCACEKDFDYQAGVRFDSLAELKKIGGVADFLKDSYEKILKSQEEYEKALAKKEADCDFADDSKRLMLCLNNKVKSAKKGEEKVAAQDKLSDALSKLFEDADDETKFREAREFFKISKANLSGQGKLDTQDSMKNSLNTLITNVSDPKALASITRLVKESVPLLSASQKKQVADVLVPKLGESIAQDYFNKFQREVKSDFDRALSDLDRAGNDPYAKRNAQERLQAAVQKLDAFMNRQDAKSFGDLNKKVTDIFGSRNSADVRGEWKKEVNPMERDFDDIRASTSSRVGQVVQRIESEDYDSSNTRSWANQDTTTRPTATNSNNSDLSNLNTRLGGRFPKNSPVDFLTNSQTLPGLRSPVGAYNTTYSTDLGRFGLNTQLLNQNSGSRVNNLSSNNSNSRGSRNSLDGFNNNPTLIYID